MISYYGGVIGIKKFIVDEAKKLNIDIVGFTGNKSLDRIEDHLRYKRENKLDTEFEERDLDLRINPKLVWDKCESIITIGISYNNKREIIDDGIRYKGNISMSSWGLDYHLVLKNKMDELIEALKSKVSFEYRTFVDTGPLVDREIAYNSQIGYYGKNCSIINEEYGSFIFIGYILTDLKLDIEEHKIENKCKDCRKCIEACPTGALYDEYKLNSKRCISYLTQTKDQIDDDLKIKMGRQIYGCDICQRVCPQNKGIKYSNNEDFKPRLNGYVDIEELFTLSNREFKEKYGYMAGSWRGRNTFIRNAIISLGNIGDLDSIKILKGYKVSGKHLEEIDWAINRIKLLNGVRP